MIDMVQFQAESLKDLSTSSSSTPYVSITSSTNSIGSVSTDKETIPKTPSALPRKTMGRIGLGADEMTGSSRKNTMSVKTIGMTVVGYMTSRDVFM